MLSIKQNVLLINRLPVIIFVVTLLLFSACSYKQNQVLFEQNTIVPDSVYQKIRANVSNYRIKPQDVLQIKNIQSSKSLIDLSAGTTGSTNTTIAADADTYDVDDDGTIALTGLGRVHVAGLTRIQARKLIEELYNKKYLKDALFDLKIINLKVTVLGEVKSPGNYLLAKDNTSLVDVLGQAGGLTESANEKNIKIIRSEKTNADVTVDLSNAAAIYDSKNILNSDDVIYVAQNKTAIRNKKVQNFSVVAQPVLLLINTALIVFTLARR
ncbi:polysaccharide biosynthesis/export family protein [Mucilaginibacter auburnensis]|uniref:Polysaccharide export outer membrane protein n=1 Tax=Mucilaginibacter auburnensis TaxID=1457233 RepID=A0A2H9VMB1_9SPHI|nr:polysaccharide biosynthesis/export family protein [Mucilaginibacter auburnensis]PJJ79445.1 polysaccharide export outer membrane protein [Mucilaginibacter auburnensis]